MTESTRDWYEAYLARDSRFDGVFFVGVTSTGIYCRPVCSAKRPRAANCRFFSTAAGAEEASFRPCLRCRPELAPGSAPVDGGGRNAAAIAHHISAGVIDDAADLEEVARHFHMSSRQMRRVLKAELGVTPVQLRTTRRLLLAKQLLTDTSLRVTEIAYASGFASLRRFNDAFQHHYRMPPGRLRSAVRSGDADVDQPTIRLLLGYRPPLNWAHLTGFLRGRATAGVEVVEGDRYARTVSIGGHRGWIEVRNLTGRDALEVELSHPLVPVLPNLLGRLKRLFDLAARTDLIEESLSRDTRLAGLIDASPGLRVPGAFDGFELAVRAILGQQVSVRAATTLAGRLAERFGEPIDTPIPGLCLLSPTSDRLARAGEQEIAGLGIVRTRARTIITLAQAVDSGELELTAGGDPAKTASALVAIPGIGPWTAQYIAMRALGWPDAFPPGDVALRNRLGGVTSRQAEEISLAWSPWRSYATLHLWNS